MNIFNTNFYEDIEKELRAIKYNMCCIGWKPYEDGYPIIRDMNWDVHDKEGGKYNNRLMLFFKPVLFEYGHFTNPKCEIWVECSFYVNSKQEMLWDFVNKTPNLKETAEFVVRQLEDATEHKLVYDEDAKFNHYKIEKYNNSRWQLKCYFSPYYANGINENHILG